MPEVHHTRSNMISKSDYNPESQELTLTFNRGGEYRYSEVPPEVNDAMLAAESIGAFFHAHIKGKYPTEKL